jgi:Cd2+/Zn2+-exporting ATPase
MFDAVGGRGCPVCEEHAEAVFRVEGLDCQDEVAQLERCLGRLAGVEAVEADVFSRRLRVTYDGAKLTSGAIAEAVARAGLRAWPEDGVPPAVAAAPLGHRAALAGVSGVALAAAAVLEFAGTGTALVAPLLAVAVVAGGWHTARRALGSLRARALDMYVLMTVAVLGAVAIHEWFEAATVVWLFAVAQLLETRAMDRARGAIRALLSLAPTDALVRRGGVEQRVPVSSVRVGEVVVVRPGEKVPLDGRVVAGESAVNQAPVTGESLPVDKKPGDEVFAGTINGHGVLEVRVTRVGDDTTIARIIHLVERAQAQRAPSQALVDRFARRYTPAVLALAAGLAVVPPLGFGQPFGPWFYRSLVLLVIACPCALVISTPVAIVSALAAAARRGVLVKGGVALERTSAVRCVAFDKTGTLTRGRLRVVGIETLDGASPSRVLALAAALEARSEHPIGRAIVRRAREEGLVVAPVEAFRALPGRGAEGRLGGTTILAGNHRLFEERGLCTPRIEARLEALASRGATAVLVAQDATPLGILAVADEVRASGREAVEQLRADGLALVLLTGDHAASARAIAADLGLDAVHADLLPEDKVAAVGALRARYGPVAMVGDGVNDAPALAAADVGVAVGAAAADAALETADLALVADELTGLPYAIRLSRATLRVIRTNIACALGLKAIFLALGAAGAATLWMAVAADMGASLAVIANGLRLRRQP